MSLDFAKMKVEAVIILLLGAAVMISCTAIPNGKEVGVKLRKDRFRALKVVYLHYVLFWCCMYRTGCC